MPTLGIIIFLLTVGLLLVVLEWFLPSGGMLGILALCALIVAVVLSYQEYGALIGTEVLGGVVAASVAGTILWLKYFPIMGPGRKLMLDSQSGVPHVASKELLNKEGEAISVLRPAGVAKINGQRLDVVSEVGQIDPGTRVRVVAVEGTRVVVRKIE